MPNKVGVCYPESLKKQYLSSSKPNPPSISCHLPSINRLLCITNPNPTYPYFNNPTPTYHVNISNNKLKLQHPSKHKHLPSTPN